MTKANGTSKTRLRRIRDPKGRWAIATLCAARIRARKSGVPFDLTKADILELGVDICPVLGIPLDYLGPGGTPHPRDDSPSLDRIIPALGYVRGNIIVISQKANTIKSNATPSELRRVADFYAALST